MCAKCFVNGSVAHNDEIKAGIIGGSAHTCTDYLDHCDIIISIASNGSNLSATSPVFQKQ